MRYRAYRTVDIRNVQKHIELTNSTMEKEGLLMALKLIEEVIHHLGQDDLVAIKKILDPFFPVTIEKNEDANPYLRTYFMEVNLKP